MSNIIIKRGMENRDPFAQSDRDPLGRNAGKGDRNRSDPKTISDRWPKGMNFIPFWKRKGRKKIK